jgi:hypothetical protein
VSDPNSNVSVLRILDGSGDTHVSWDRDGVAAGDPEAMAAVREAERIFEKARAGGAAAFQIMPHGPARRLDRFDPEAKEVLVIPAMVGG